jgi:hypothetical protein
MRTILGSGPRVPRFTLLYPRATHGCALRCAGGVVTRRIAHNNTWKEKQMNTRSLVCATTAALLALASVGASAQAASVPGTRTPRIDQRQANQERRIDQGVASGELTRRETRRVERQQNAIDKAENKATADGSVSAQERRRLTKAQNHASRSIARQKHDAQERPAAAKP